MKAPITYPAAQGVCQNSSVQSSQPSTNLIPARRNEDNIDDTPNIVFFGEAGVGKSSIINLIAGQKVAHTSDDALGGTLQQRHVVTVDGTSCALWDTTGLGEGGKGAIPEAKTSNLGLLIQWLAHTEGINLVIYCIRASRLTKVIQQNYELFYVAVCQKKVPIALVITGLEHQEGEMETWWIENRGVLQQYKMRFDAHECVTTLDAEDSVTQQRRFDSQRRLRELMVRYSKLPAWKVNSEPTTLQRAPEPSHAAAKRWIIAVVDMVRSAARNFCRS